ncbi:response regulator [Paraflavisolibacter sp. H34]|uniref:response regulator n=1 Tax=Huijunlia imazamoxiresistens TaxID=3127457 RepID=UPI003018D3DD
MKHKHNILIVDDDADDREIIRDAFLSNSNGQNEYIFIENGDKLIEYLDNCQEKEYPALILLDLNMPGKDGREALREIKSSEQFHHIPTVIFTTSSSDRDREMSYGLGANCFVTKPDTFNKLVDLTSSIAKLWLPHK